MRPGRAGAGRGAGWGVSLALRRRVVRPYDKSRVAEI